MPIDFTVQRIPWADGALMIQELRVSASTLGTLDYSITPGDSDDEISKHVLALGTRGQAIGCARVSPVGHIDRITVLPLENWKQIGVAMIEALMDDYIDHIESLNKSQA